jgi:hypothetical protein
MWHHLAEERIRQAIDNGDFESLTTRGQTIDLTAYFAMPEELRAGLTMLQNAGVVPQEVELMKEISLLRASPNADAKRLQELEVSLALILERNRR